MFCYITFTSFLRWSSRLLILLAIVFLGLSRPVQANNGWVVCATGSFSAGNNTINFNKSDCGFTDFEKIYFNALCTVGQTPMHVSFNGEYPITKTCLLSGAYFQYTLLGSTLTIDFMAASPGNYEIEAYRPGLDESIQGLNLPVAKVNSKQFSAAAGGFVSGGLLLVLLVYFNGLQMFVSTVQLLMRVIGFKL